ncbi:MAG: hypothetical protein Q9211_000389 [Gyalolechia sp. 1 TL-2023]
MSGRRSSPDALAPVVFSALEVLNFNDDQLVQLLNDCRTESGQFEISERIAGVDVLSVDQREELGKKISVALEKAGPLNTSKLSKLLGEIADHDSTGDAISRWESRFVRSPTESPRPVDEYQYEVFCHDELVKAGGRPAVPIELLSHPARDAEASREKFKPWLGNAYPGSPPDIFSAQTDDWMTFQHRWQWDNRGKFAGEEGFSEALEWEKKKHINRGDWKWPSKPAFEEVERSIWGHAERDLEISGKEGFTAYTHAVEKRLASHKFTQPFQLAENPRQQDAWTTWVEYLNYVYWWRDAHAEEMEATESRYLDVWDDLKRFKPSQISPTSTTRTLDEELSATRSELEASRQLISKYVYAAKVHKRQQRRVRTCELRVAWVLEQLSLMGPPTPSLEHEVPKHNSSASSGKKKRKLRDNNHDTLARPQPKKKKRQETSHSGSIPEESEPQAGNGSDTATLNTRAATSTGADSGPRRSQRIRSQRRRVDDATTEALLSEPQAGAPSMPKRSRQTRTQKGTRASTARKRTPKR